jgi:hypothetical protein
MRGPEEDGQTQVCLLVTGTTEPPEIFAHVWVTATFAAPMWAKYDDGAPPAVGVTEFDGEDAAPVPTAFVAETVNV